MNGQLTIILTSLFFALAVSAQGADPFAAARGKVNLGATRDQCRSAIKYRELRPAEATKLLNLHPWVETHSYLLTSLKAGRVVVWTDDNEVYLGWPIYVFGTFSE